MFGSAGGVRKRKRGRRWSWESTSSSARRPWRKPGRWLWKSIGAPTSAVRSTVRRNRQSTRCGWSNAELAPVGVRLQIRLAAASEGKGEKLPPSFVNRTAAARRTVKASRYALLVDCVPGDEKSTSHRQIGRAHV